MSREEVLEKIIKLLRSMVDGKTNGPPPGGGKVEEDPKFGGMDSAATTSFYEQFPEAARIENAGSAGNFGVQPPLRRAAPVTVEQQRAFYELFPDADRLN